MITSLLSTPTAEPAHQVSLVDSHEPRVEFRAAPLEEIRQIDLSAREVVLPTLILMTRREFRKAMDPFPLERSSFHETTMAAPGSLIWAQLASRAGDMIVGGRDINGLPSVPLPINGDIFFVSAAPKAAGDRSASLPGASPVSVTLNETSISDPEQCQPIISADGVISCASFECERCLRVIARNSWTTSIACMCGFEAGTGSLDISIE